MKEGLESLSDRALLDSLKHLIFREREYIVKVLKHLGEVDHRRAYLPAAFPSLFAYCVEELHYSEGEAYRRIRAARAAREFPVIYALLERGRVSLTTVTLLAPHLCRENYSALLKQASGKSRREVERLVASLDPKRETVDHIRYLGIRGTLPGEDASPGGAAEPKHVQRIRLQFTADEALLFKIERARGFLRHKFPSGRMEFIVNEAVEALLDKRDPERRLQRREKRRNKKRSPGGR